MPGHARAISPRAVQIRIAVALETQGGRLGAGIPEMAGDASGVDPGDPDQPARLQPAIEMLRRAEVRGLGDRGPQDHAAGVAVDGLDVFVVGADVADVREGERDQLPGIGGIGQDLLIAGHGGIEDQFAHDGAGRSQPLAEKRRAVGEHEGGPGPAAYGNTHGRGGSLSVSSETRPKRPSRPGAEAPRAYVRAPSTVKRGWSGPRSVHLRSITSNDSPK